MPAYIVTYDLHKEGQNYECLSEKLKTYPDNWRVQGSVWIISTAKEAPQIRDELKPCLDSNDKLIVARLDGLAAWHGYSDEASDWLRGVL